MNEFLNALKNSITKDTDYSPLGLAYLGDAVFELLVRTYVLNKGKTSVNNMHKNSKSIVNAAAQAKMYFKLLDYLSDEETAILKWGRNAKSYTSSKNASVLDYRHATGLEALFGYLFLKGKNERILELFDICLNLKNLN